MDGQTASIFVTRLKREGYFGGISEPTWATRIAPSITYSNNINGGNPDKKLVLGNLEFDGDPNLVAREGVIGRVNIAASNRITFSEGRYLIARLGGALSYSPAHNISYTNRSAKICSRNKIIHEFHVDLCGSMSRQKKEISKDRTDNFRISVSHLSNLDKVGYLEWSMTASRSIQSDYSQNQLKMSVDLIHRDTWFASLGLRAGEPLKNQLALDYGANILFSRALGGKKITIDLAYEHMKGGKLFGFTRADRVTSATLSMPLVNNITASVGFYKSDSSINYFDQDYPIIGLTYNW